MTCVEISKSPPDQAQGIFAFETKRERRSRLRAILCERFPACFTVRGRDKRPLAIGIREELIQRCPDLTENDIRDALFDYARGAYHYRSKFLFGTIRVDLDGEPCGMVEERASQHAGAILMDAGLVEAALAIARSLPAEAREVAA